MPAGEESAQGGRERGENEGERGAGEGLGGAPGRYSVLQVSTRPGRAEKLDSGFTPHPGPEAFSVCAQQCGDGKNRPNKHRISSKSRLGGEFLSSPGLPNAPLVLHR
jgi:hypothetical protein